MPDRPNKETIFHQACEIEDVSQRAAFIEQACQGDESLRAEIEQLLELDDQRDSLLDFELTNLAQTSDSFPILEKTGDEIGPFKLLQKVGEGGMGVVYMAEQKKPVRRRVALKIIKPGMDSREVIARFEAERQALAMMDHPNIAKVLDCGTTQTGRPFFVMELVKGVSITKYCDANHLNPRERLELFVPVCQAIQHAHQKGIIHRDIKPSNILIAEYDHTPVPKIIDFGVAKALNQQLTSKTMFTQLGQIIGTLEYMSPEQAKVNQLDVDTRSDIYSLGVLLYELLSGATPFDTIRLRSVAIDELMRILREEDPPRPSTRLSTIETLPSIAANRKTEPKKLSTLLHGELDWIVMKAMEKDRGRRYDSASAFADDIQNYLNDNAVLACPPSSAYRFRKFARRNKVAIATGGLVSAALILGIIGTSWQAVRASRLAKRESAAHQLAQERLVSEQQARQEAVRAKMEETKQRELAIAERKSAEQARDAAETEAVRASTVVEVLKELFESGNTNDEFAKPVNFTVRELLLNMADRLPERLKEQPEVEADVRAIIGRALTSFFSANEIYRATDQLKSALKMRREIFGDQHFKTVDSILDLSDFYWRIGSHARSEVQTQIALEQSRRLLEEAPTDSNNRHLRIRSLRYALRGAGWKKRLTLCEEAIELGRDGLAKDNMYLAKIRELYAESKWKEYKYAQATGMSSQQTDMNAVMSFAKHALVENTRIFGAEHPRTASCLALLGKLELANENRDGAEQYFRQAFEIGKKFGTSSLSNFENVLTNDEYEEMVDRNFKFGGGAVLAYRAIEQFEKGNLAEYQRMIARLIKNYDDGGLGPWYLGYACSLSEHAVNDWQPVIEFIRNSKPNSLMDETERQAILGSVLLRAGQTREANELFTIKFEEWKPLKTALWHDSFALADVWHYEVMRAIALHRVGKTEDAKQQFINVASEAPRFLVGHEFVAGGIVKSKLKVLLNEAQIELQISPKWFPVDSQNPWSYVARGQLYQTEGNAEKAIADFGHAIDLQPDNVYLLTLRAKALRASGKPDLAISDCNQVLELQPGNVGGHDVRGQCLNDLEQFEEAIADFSQAIESNPNHSWSYHHRADCFKKLEQLDRAIADYTRAIESKPDFVWSYQHRGDCYQALGQYKKAIVDYEKALQLRGAQPNDLLAKLIACYRELDQLDDLIKRLDEIVGYETTDAEYWHRRGDFLHSLKRPKQAIKSYSKVLEINPEHGWARINRSNRLTKSNSNQYAVDDYEQTIDLDNLTKTKMPFGRFCFEVGERLLRLEQYEMASSILEKAIRLTPNMTHYHKRAALAHFHLGQFVEAIDDLKIRVEKSPDDTSTIVWISPDKVAACKDESFKTELLKLSDRLFELSERKQWVLYDRGWILLKCGDLEGAEECFDGAIARTPNDTNLWNNIGVLYSNFGNHKKAQDLFSKAIKLDGQQSRAWNLRGLSYFRMGQFDKARKDFAKFAELKPQNPVARSNQAAALFELGDFEQSIAVADAAIKLSPNHAHSLQVRAKSQVALQRWSDAIDDYTQLIEIEPEKLEHLAARGKAYSGAGEQEKSDADFAKYIVSFDKLVEGKPDDWQTFNRRGVAKTKIERWEQAIKDFNKSLELAPQEIVIWKNLANCYCEQGDWKSAIGKLAKALELGDENWLTYYHMALCQLAADEPDGYRSTCQSMVEAFADTDEAATANFTAWTCSLAPDAVEDYSVVLDLAEKAWSSNQENDQYVKTLAAIHFRMGEYSVALDQLNKVNDRQATSAAHSNSSPAYTWYLLALTHKADGNHSLAEGFRTKAKQWTADKLAGEAPLAWNRKLTLELLQAEANMTNATSAEGDLFSETAGALPATIKVIGK